MYSTIILSTFVSGYYAYTEVTNRTGFFADAHLVSPFFKQAGKQCQFKFWYHMWGPNIGYLQVYFRRNSRDKRLFSIAGNQGNMWKQGMVNVPKCANDFQVSDCILPTLSLPESNLESINVVVPFESVDESY